MSLFVFMFYFDDFFSFGQLAAFEISGSYYWLSSYHIFSSNDGQFQIVSFIHFGIFRSFANRGSGESFLIPRL